MRDLGRLMMLFDFYGGLLTERQRQAFGLHYADDLSLGEIAVEFGLTRPAVRDLIRRAERTLERAEASSGMVKRHEADRAFLRDLLRLLEEGSAEAAGEARRRLVRWLEEGGEDDV